MDKPDNPPAFPRPGFEQPAGMQDGMTLRDWFAGQALAGLLAHASGEDPHKAPEMAYRLADAMLAEREKRNAS